MAFTDRQKRDHIAELQRNLYDISFVNEKIPPIIPDGIYGKETAQAVKAFQYANNLDATGEADSQTWSAIIDYCKSLKGPMPIFVIPKNFDLSENSPRDIIYIIQVMLNRLSNDFHNFPKIEIDGLYSTEMKKALTNFSEIIGVSCAKFDVDSWNMLAELYNARRK